MKAAPLFLAVIAAVSPCAFALDAAQQRAERERIASERAQVEDAFAQREAACRERFVVTSCLDDARRDRRQARERLRQQQTILDEVERKQRAAQRMDDIRSKLSSQEAQGHEAARERRRGKLRSDVLGRASPSGVEPGASAALVLAGGAAAAASAARSAEEARRVADYEKRQAAAREHREAVERRNAERASHGKPPAKPLPVPSAPAASAR